MRSLAAAAAIIAMSAAPLFAAGADSDYSVQAGDPLATAKTLILAKKFDQAVVELTPIASKADASADAHNLLGFSLRKTGRLEEAGRAYEAALSRNPRHLGALEYQGELFLMLGEVEKAEANLAQIADQCIFGCDEEKLLEAAIAEWRAAQGS